MYKYTNVITTCDLCDNGGDWHVLDNMIIIGISNSTEKRTASYYSPKPKKHKNRLHNQTLIQMNTYINNNHQTHQAKPFVELR